MNKMKCTLVKSLIITEEVRSFYLRLDEPFTFVPGQYVMISFTDNDVKRAFSIVDYDIKSRELCLLIKINGELTKKLFSSSIGTEMNLFGPYGRFTLPKENLPVIFIGGGIGITPLYNMMKNAKGRKMCLYYSSRTREEVLLHKELKTFDTKFFLTRQKSDGFREGRISAKIIKEEQKDFLKSIFFICGPEEMIQDMRKQLILEGISEENIRSESFS